MQGSINVIIRAPEPSVVDRSNCPVHAFVIFAKSQKHTASAQSAIHYTVMHTKYIQPNSQVMQSRAEQVVSNRKRAGWEPHCCCHFRLLLSGQKAPAAQLIMDP